MTQHIIFHSCPCLYYNEYSRHHSPYATHHRTIKHTSGAISASYPLQQLSWLVDCHFLKNLFNMLHQHSWERCAQMAMPNEQSYMSVNTNEQGIMRAPKIQLRNFYISSRCHSYYTIPALFRFMHLVQSNTIYDFSGISLFYYNSHSHHHPHNGLTIELSNAPHELFMRRSHCHDTFAQLITTFTTPSFMLHQGS